MFAAPGSLQAPAWRRNWQRPAIDFAIGSQRQLVEDDKRRRNHVIGKFSLQQVYPVSGRFPFLEHHIGHEPALLGLILARDNYGILDARGGLQNGLHFARLDAEAANLDLVIRSPDEFDVPIGQILDNVARPIEPLAPSVENASATKRSRVNSGWLR